MLGRTAPPHQRSGCWPIAERVAARAARRRRGSPSNGTEPGVGPSGPSGPSGRSELSHSQHEHRRWRRRSPRPSSNPFRNLSPNQLENPSVRWPRSRTRAQKSNGTKTMSCHHRHRLPSRPPLRVGKRALSGAILRKKDGGESVLRRAAGRTSPRGTVLADESTNEPTKSDPRPFGSPYHRHASPQRSLQRNLQRASPYA
mmetsp:Transcript_5276/g.11767  ORF Transcript_5276/g.11767 Transcript_5276/m.11767 type:complete len:200 (+) Transcript_5276:772-1371(+)